MNNVYDVNNICGMNNINYHDVNCTAEYNLLHDIIDTSKIT